MPQCTLNPGIKYPTTKLNLANLATFSSNKRMRRRGRRRKGGGGGGERDFLPRFLQKTNLQVDFD